MWEFQKSKNSEVISEILSSHVTNSELQSLQKFLQSGHLRNALRSALKYLVCHKRDISMHIKYVMGTHNKDELF